jgi:nitrile hydratase
VNREVHDRGVRPTEESIDRTEHELDDWELRTDALMGALVARGVINLDEMRRAIESMPSPEYEKASYYERWLFAIETLVVEKGLVSQDDLNARLA